MLVHVKYNPTIIPNSFEICKVVLPCDKLWGDLIKTKNIWFKNKSSIVDLNVLQPSKVQIAKPFDGGATNIQSK
jgi:hypothetical protein